MITRLGRVNVFIAALSAFSVLVIGLWIYTKYLKPHNGDLLTHTVTRGEIADIVRLRGEAVAQKEFELGFSAGGTVARILVSEGEEVREGQRLVTLDTAGLYLEAKKVEAVLEQRELNLQKIISGSTEEDIAVSATQVANARQALADKYASLAQYVNDAYTKTSSAVQAHVDQFFDNPKTIAVNLNIAHVSSQTRADLENGRKAMEDMLQRWKLDVARLSEDNLGERARVAGENLMTTRDFLDTLAEAVNMLSTASSYTAAQIATYRADAATARASVNTAMLNLTAAEEAVRTARSALSLAESRLGLKQAGTREEDIAAARAMVEESRSDLQAVYDKIRRAALVAPVDATVTKVAVEKGEALIAGETVVVLAGALFKIIADVSELDIVKIPEGAEAPTLVEFDAFPDEEFGGKVLSIEPKEIKKDEDTYYRVNFHFDAGDTPVRSGMSADLTVTTKQKSDAIIVPEYAVFDLEGESHVTLLRDGKKEDVSVRTGLSDGDMVEILSGAQAGDTLVIEAR